MKNLLRSSSTALWGDNARETLSFCGICALRERKLAELENMF
jgi:hypothetical protein